MSAQQPSGTVISEQALTHWRNLTAEADGIVARIQGLTIHNDDDQRHITQQLAELGEKFDIKWTIHNNGTKTMIAGLDLKFSNGDKLMSNKIIELPELKPGAEFTVNFDATAPSKAGTYIMAYLVEGCLCYPYTAIVVEK